MTDQSRARWIRAAWGVGLIAIVAIAALLAWKYIEGRRGRVIASANGRIEATEINIAAKYAGRIAKEFVDEGDYVTTGQVVAKMDTDVLQAQLREAKAKVQEAQSTIASKRSKLAENESKKAAAQATVLQRQAELWAAKKRADRTAVLAGRASVSQQEADDDKARVETYDAAISAAKAQVAAAEAAIVSARSEVLEAQSSYEAAMATVQRIQADIDDSDLKAPVDGRIQYRVAQPLEVVAAGGRVLNMIDLSDVYMTFFLPTKETGQVMLGSDVRIVLDAAPQYVIPAKVTFVADVAQFTPKTVETASEREKLTFRLKAHIPPELLRKYIKEVKTGLPGMAYVRLDPQAPWPDRLQVRLPNE
jgi:HlyD family secretion protein